MGRLFLLTKPMGVMIVRLCYLAGLTLLVAYVAHDLYISLYSSAPLSDVPHDPVADLLRNIGLLLGGFVVLRLIAEMLVAQLEIRDKLGAIEQNTLDARHKLGAVERNTTR